MIDFIELISFSAYYSFTYCHLLVSCGLCLKLHR